MEQIVGIPMGIDLAPFRANRHFYKYEFDFQENKSKQDPKVAKYLFYIFRYIDDITRINDNGSFDKYRAEIYPKGFKVTKDTNGPKKCKCAKY